MADFNVTARNGNIINVPDFAKLNIDGLEIIGDQTTDWNEPIQKNFLAIDKKVMNVENNKVDNSKVLTDVPAGAVFTDTVYTKPTSEPISYISGLNDELDSKADKNELLDKDAILAMGFRDTDSDTQLSGSEISAMGFVKKTEVNDFVDFNVDLGGIEDE